MDRQIDRTAVVEHPDWRLVIAFVAPDHKHWHTSEPLAGLNLFGQRL